MHAAKPFILKLRQTWKYDNRDSKDYNCILDKPNLFK